MRKGLAYKMTVDLKRVISLLGRVPNFQEYLVKGVFSESTIKEFFGSWNAFIQSTGAFNIKETKKTKQENRKAAFNSLQKEISEKKNKISPPVIGRNILIIPDLHAPFMHHQAVDFIKAVINKYGYDVAMCCGDETDGSAISFHGADPNLPSPGHELELAIKQLTPLYSLFPNLLIASSNHGDLLARKMKHHGLPIRALKSMNEILECPSGWKWDFEHVIQMSNGKKLLLHHSYSSSVLRSSQQRGISCVFGHHHSKFSIEYWKNYDDIYFAIFAGCLVDPLSLAMAYAKNIQNRPITGLVRIEDGIPHLIPMILDSANVWNGKIY